MTLVSWLSIVLSFFFCLQVQGAKGFKGGVGFITLNQSTEGDTLSKSETTTTEYNVKLGYLNDKVYYAVLLDSWSNDNSGTTANRSSNGFAIGYHGKAWYMDATYFFSSQYTAASGAKLKEGSGVGVDIGYNFLKDSTKYFVNAQLSYKSFEYKKVAQTTEKNSHSEMMPMFVFGMTFAR